MNDKIKILIADDEENVLSLISNLLNEAGYDVRQARDGEEALRNAFEGKPDLILLDVKMPKKDGFEVCSSIREDPEIGGTPIIIVSALGDEYNKITGFKEGADDYVTKPINAEELKARVQALLLRTYGLRPAVTRKISPPQMLLERVKTGISSLDKSLEGGLPKGSNILLIGSLGKGKSSFCRQFIAAGIKMSEKCIYVAVDDDPDLIRQQLFEILKSPVKDLERLGMLRFVDAYSWTTGEVKKEEKFAVTGVLELTQFSGVIRDAGAELGQTVQEKAGGRRVIDSISSLLVNFELPSIQKFLSGIARTGIAFGGVTTVFVLEEGSVSDQVLNNIKYIMDGVIEFKEESGKRFLRIANMKWIKYPRDLIEW